MVVAIRRVPKRERQKALMALLDENPVLTDEELAQRFGVSVQTIRLDRLELGIPELRERLKDVARRQLDPIRSLRQDEVIGEIVDLELDRYAISILDIGDGHVFARTGIARGHHIFAQANSLAVAVTDAEVALTASARIRFVRPVYRGERLVAKATVVASDPERNRVRVETRVGGELVFSGTFTVYRAAREAQREAGGIADADRH